MKIQKHRQNAHFSLILSTYLVRFTLQIRALTTFIPKGLIVKLHLFWSNMYSAP